MNRFHKIIELLGLSMILVTSSACDEAELCGEGSYSSIGRVDINRDGYPEVEVFEDENGEIVTEHDYDSNGMPELITVKTGNTLVTDYDTDQDGMPDITVIAEDTNGDGKPDVVRTIVRAKGKTLIEQRMVDFDHDGKYDVSVLEIDTDGDGELDYEEHRRDSNGDGVPDQLFNPLGE